MGGIQGEEGARGIWKPGVSSGASSRRSHLLFEGAGWEGCTHQGCGSGDTAPPFSCREQLHGGVFRGTKTTNAQDLPRSRAILPASSPSIRRTRPLARVTRYLMNEPTLGDFLVKLRLQFHFGLMSSIKNVKKNRNQIARSRGVTRASNTESPPKNGQKMESAIYLRPRRREVGDEQTDSIVRGTQHPYFRSYGAIVIDAGTFLGVLL